MHRTIGILGGMSPESTITYYQVITREYTAQYGDHNYPPIVIYSVRFQPYIDWPKQGEWDRVTEGLVKASRALERAGAEFIVIATNTMHLVLDGIQSGISIPILSLLDVTADAIEAQGATRVGLLGTRFTMKKRFYHEALASRGIDVFSPDEDDIELVNSIIYDELIRGEVREESRQKVVAVIDKMRANGAQGIIAGCTEIPLLINEAVAGMPVFDTTALHARAALDFAINNPVGEES